ncbi:MAG: glucosaminidase domain-containing protein [Alphaproteobacteria bacterium]
MRFRKSGRPAFLAAVLACAFMLYWYTGVERGLRAPEDSMALHRVRDVSLDDIRRTGQVAPAFVDRFDVDLSVVPANERKQAFFRVAMPLVARENDRIRAERKVVLEKPDDIPLDLYERYGVKPGDIGALKQRVDVVPASLVLAQAAVESGWGTSRFARHGNNLFGMRTYDPDAPGLAPEKAVGFRVMQFESLGHGVAAYMLNLNRHDAYTQFRQARAAMRLSGKPATGLALTGLLTAYSEIPEQYGGILRNVIQAEKLGHFDEIRLFAN